MSKRDFYEVLGVSRDADDKALKSAYRKLAMQNHPDRNPDDEAAGERFRDASEAYDILKDPQKRAAYDQLGHAAFENAGAGAGGGFGGGGFADIFDQMFSEFSGGARGGQGQDRSGSDLRYDMNVTLEEAYSGKKTNIDIPTSISCNTCNGTGAQSGASPTSCPTCSGIGKVRAQQGFFTVERTCPTCSVRPQHFEDVPNIFRMSPTFSGCPQHFQIFQHFQISYYKNFKIHKDNNQSNNTYYQTIILYITKIIAT